MMQAVSLAHQTHIPAGHSGRIKYANPQDLPSYPSTGLKENGAAASAAASLGWANQKTYEPWKPTSSSSASTAALLANDYRMPPVHETQRSSAGHQAAVLAAGSAQKSPRPEPLSPQSTWGNSAANMAYRAANASSTHSKPDDGVTLARGQSLSGAHGAFSGARPRSISTPQKHTYPDQANAAANALSAATVAHRPKTPFDEAGAVPYTNMKREMYTSRPPVKPEVDEKQHADSLHASAVAMAKRMYNQQQKMIDNAKRSDAEYGAARSSSFSRHGGEASPVHLSDGKEQNTRFPNLQEAAYRLAQERLAKLHDEHQKSRDYEEWYGSKPQHATGRLGSIRGKLTRRRSSSDGDLIEDRKRSQEIRQQMSMFSNKLSKVDEEKRARDRQALLAAAQRNVKAQLEGMDQKVYEDTGRVPPRMLSEWEMKAHSAALMRSESRRNENAGKVDLGGGKFMDQDEVNAIAAKRVQPVIDDINRKAEAEKERQLAAKLEEEHRKEVHEREKAREKEVQDIHKKLKDQQKEDERHIKAEAKAAEKAKKDEEKAAKAEQKRQAKEGKQKQKDVPHPVALDLEKKATEQDHQPEDSREDELQTAALVAPVPPVQPVQPATPVETPAPVTSAKKQPTSSAKTEAKEDPKVKKQEEKAAKAEQKRLAKEEKRRSEASKKPLALDLKKRVAKEEREHGLVTAPMHGTTETSATQGAVTKERSKSFSRRRDSSPALDDEPKSPTLKIKNWLQSHFSRPRTKSSSSATAAEDNSAGPVSGSGFNGGGTGAGEERSKGFIGGAALRDGRNDSTDSENSSLRDVAFATVSRDARRRELGLPATVATAPPEPQEAVSPLRESSSASSSTSAVSSLSASDGEERDDFVEAEEDVPGQLTPPPSLPKDPATVGRLSISPVRGSRFAEIID